MESGFSQETKARAIDLAWTANDTHSQLVSLRGQQTRLEELAAMGLQGVTIEPSAKTELAERISITEQNFNLQIKMAGLVTKHVDPYDLKIVSQLPADHNFVTWEHSDEEELVAVVSDENFRAIYSFLNPELKSIAASRTYTRITADIGRVSHTDDNEVQKPFKKEWYFVREIVVNDHYTKKEYLPRIDKLDEMLDVLSSKLDDIYSLGEKGIQVLETVARFYRHNSEQLLKEPTRQTEDQTF